MLVQTSRFGDVEVDDANIIEVPSGFPGFPALHRVALLAVGAVPAHDPQPETVGMYWMQDLDDGSLAFLCIDPWTPFPEYDIDIDESALEIDDPADVSVLVLVTVRRGDGRAVMTANLKAPVVIDLGGRTAHQVILNDRRWAIDAPFAATAPSEPSDTPEVK